MSSRLTTANNTQSPAMMSSEHRRTRDLVDPCRKTHGELLQLPNGPFWEALAQAVRTASTDRQKYYPRSERKQVQREGYVNSETAILGSSPTVPSSSEFEVDVDDVDEDEHDERRSQPEEVTMYLILCFLQQALNRCLEQHPRHSADGGTDASRAQEGRCSHRRNGQRHGRGRWGDVQGALGEAWMDHGSPILGLTGGQRCQLAHPSHRILTST